MRDHQVQPVVRATETVAGQVPLLVIAKGLAERPSRDRRAAGVAGVGLDPHLTAGGIIAGAGADRLGCRGDRFLDLVERVVDELAQERRLPRLERARQARAGHPAQVVAQVFGSIGEVVRIDPHALQETLDRSVGGAEIGVHGLGPGGVDVAEGAATDVVLGPPLDHWRAEAAIGQRRRRIFEPVDEPHRIVSRAAVVEAGQRAVVIGVLHGVRIGARREARVGNGERLAIARLVGRFHDPVSGRDRKDVGEDVAPDAEREVHRLGHDWRRSLDTGQEPQEALPARGVELFVGAQSGAGVEPVQAQELLAPVVVLRQAAARGQCSGQLRVFVVAVAPAERVRQAADDRAFLAQEQVTAAVGDLDQFAAVAVPDQRLMRRTLVLGIAGIALEHDVGILKRGGAVALALNGDAVVVGLSLRGAVLGGEIGATVAVDDLGEIVRQPPGMADSRIAVADPPAAGHVRGRRRDHLGQIAEVVVEVAPDPTCMVRQLRDAPAIVAGETDHPVRMVDPHLRQPVAVIAEGEEIAEAIDYPRDPPLMRALGRGLVSRPRSCRPTRPARRPATWTCSPC